MAELAVFINDGQFPGGHEVHIEYQYLLIHHIKESRQSILQVVRPLHLSAVVRSVLALILTPLDVHPEHSRPLNVYLHGVRLIAEWVVDHELLSVSDAALLHVLVDQREWLWFVGSVVL